MNKSQRLVNVINKDSRRIIGLMSGMSIDGIDLACVDISGNFPELKIEVVGTYFQPYSKELQTRLFEARSAPPSEVSNLNVIVANQFSKCVLDFLSEKGISTDSIDAIGSHGQTLYHSTDPDTRTHSTLQIGSPSIISEITGIMTIGNFRVRDIAGGGRGAPLVSIADYILFRDPSGPIAMNNLGSISNVTVVTPAMDDMLAFDTGPANMPIDFFAKLIPGNDDGIDLNGQYSKSVTCIPELLSELLAIPFFNRPPPKSAGYNEFGPAMLARLANLYVDHDPENLLRTAVEFSAITIANAYRNFVLPKFPSLKKVTFSGGGIYNTTLIDRIQRLLPELTVHLLKNDLSDSKEAIAFALLANETLSGRAGSITSVTGVANPTVLGELAL
jgi:anhydro-N-acetylmuramic acid kinase